MTRLDLEDRLRNSLQDRATDVQASPQMWSRVDERITARRRTTMLALAGGTAVAVAAAAVVVPNLLDRGPTTPSVTVDPSPSGQASDPDIEGGTGVQPSGAFADPTHAVAVQGGALKVLAVGDGAVVASFPLAGDPVALAARPRMAGEPWEVAYVLSVPDGWEQHVLTIDTRAGGDAFDGATSQDTVLSTVLGSRTDELQPGVTWSPDGRFLAWMINLQDSDAGPHSSIGIFDWAARQGATDGSFLTGEQVSDESMTFEVANGSTYGRLTLKSWTWDDQYEDGRVGRLFLTGDGRSWEVEVTHSGGLSVGALNPIDVADDFDDAGPAFGTYHLFADVQGGFFRVEGLQERDDRFSYGGTLDGIDSAALDFAAVNGWFIVGQGSGLYFGGPGTTGMTIDNGMPWGPVDLFQERWIPVMVPQSGEAAPTNPSTPVPSDSPPAPMPGFIVTTDGMDIDLRWSDGRLIQTLYRLAAPDEGEVIGLDVRPGSSTEDLTVAFTTAKDGQLTAWSLRGRADDQVGLSVIVQPWPAAQQPAADAEAFNDGERTIPVFSGDGDYVAWVENTPDGATFRAFGWLPDADLPGTGDTASDNVGFSRGNVPQTLEYFSDLAVGRGGQPGYYALFTGADGTTSTCEYERQADGALAETICEGDLGADRSVADLTDQVFLETVDGRLRLYDYPRSWAGDTEQVTLWPLPVELELATQDIVWMTGRSDHVFVGVSDQSWLVTPEGAQEMPQGITFIAGVR